MRRIAPLLLLLSTSLHAQAAAGGDPASAVEAAWKANLKSFLEVESRLERASGDARARLLAEHGLSGADWGAIAGRLHVWMATEEGFAAARQAVADDLAPIEGFSLEQFARASATLVNGVEAEELLARLSLDAEAWLRIQGGWSTRMQWDRSRVLTTLYSHYFLLGLEGEYRAIAEDAARGILPGGTLGEPEPIPFERYVEIQSAISIGSRRGRNATEIPPQLFALSFADWIAISHWWGVALRGEGGAELAARMASLRAEYEKKYEAMFVAEAGGALPPVGDLPGG